MSFFKVNFSFVALAIKESIFVFKRKTGQYFQCEHTYKKDIVDMVNSVDFISFSPKNNYFLALFSDKTLVVWKIDENELPWKKMVKISVNRRSTSAAFCCNEEKIYVADKSGDLYCIDVHSAEVIPSLDEAKPVLGHVSILLDVLVNEKYIITADRDEKIRVSLKKYPYIIQSFCLGHTEFVSKVAEVNDNCLISTSGDGSIRVWNASTGSQITMEQVHNDKRSSVPALLSYSKVLNLAAVGTIGIKNDVINIYKFSEKSQDIQLRYQISLSKGCVDLTFGCYQQESCTITLFVLIQLDNSLAIKTFSCSCLGYEEIKSNEIKLINDNLKEFCTSNAFRCNYLDLFKNTIPGHTYEAFYQKRQKVLENGSNKKFKLN